MEVNRATSRMNRDWNSESCRFSRKERAYRAALSWRDQCRLRDNGVLSTKVYSEENNYSLLTWLKSFFIALSRFDSTIPPKWPGVQTITRVLAVTRGKFFANRNGLRIIRNKTGVSFNWYNASQSEGTNLGSIGF